MLLELIDRGHELFVPELQVSEGVVIHQGDIRCVMLITAKVKAKGQGR